jgi:5-methylthioadenosine/S-adenosylhomocysteine deaminase
MELKKDQNRTGPCSVRSRLKGACLKRVIVLVAKTWVLLGALFSTTALHCQDESYALSGTLVTARGVVDDGVVLISHGAIEGIGSKIPIPKGTPVIETGGVIFPGLIDLHDHLVWNVFPRWGPPSPVGNRYDWQAMPDYSAKLSGPEATLIGRGLGCDMERYAEIKAMLGGATSLVGSFSPTDADPHRDDCDRGLARNLDFFSGLYSREMNAEPLDYEVFPFEIPAARAQSIRDSLSSGKLKTLLIHVSEGQDASAAREYRMLKASGFLRPGVSVIHGVALQKAQFQEMAENGVGLIWSPHSNVALYGKTTDIASAKAAGLTIAIAPDWSPSGSNSMVEELQYAFRWNSQQPQKIFDAPDFVQMATVNAAKLAGASDKIGSLAAGMAADIVVFPPKGNSAWAALLDADPGSIRLVLVGGKAKLGDPDLMKKLLPGGHFDTVTVCQHDKSLNLDGETGGESWNEIQSNLTRELHNVSSSLSELAKCN